MVSFIFLAHPKYFLRFFYFLPRLLRLVHSQSFINAPPSKQSTGLFSLRSASNPFFSLYIKNKKHRKGCLLFFWPTRRDLNPHSPESESVALSNCATDGYKPHFSYGCFLLSNTINQRVLPKLRTALPARFGDSQVFW